MADSRRDEPPPKDHGSATRRSGQFDRLDALNLAEGLSQTVCWKAHSAAFHFC